MTTLSTIVTWNLLFKGVIGGMITAVVAMGIVLVYRSSRVINFAVGNMGVPATALFAIMAGKHGWPYWPALVRRLARRHADGHRHRAHRDPPAVPVAARHRAGRDDRRRAAVRSRHAVLTGVPNRLVTDAIPVAVQRRVASVPRHHRVREPAPGADRRPGHHGRALVAARPHRVRRRGARVGDERRPRPHDRHQPEARVHRGLVDRRLPRHGRGAAHRERPRLDRPRSTSAPTRCSAAWPPRSSAAWSRSPRRTRGDPHRHLRPRPVLQLHDRDRARAVPALHRGARARRARQQTGRAGRGRELPVRTARRGRSRTAQEHLVGAAHAAIDRGLRADRRGHRAAALGPVGAAPDVDGDPRVRAVRGVGRRADGLGWSALARADGVRGPRRADRRGPVTRHVREHRLARHPHHQRFAALPSRSRGRCCSARSVRASSRCSSASARSAYAACCSPSAPSRSRSRRRSTCSTVRSSRPGDRPCRSRAPTSGRSSSPTRTARTTTSCCSCSSWCCCSSAISAVPASGA